MAIEVATYISDLDPANPKGSDQRSTLDDHSRLNKQVIQNTFPNVSAEVSASAGELNYMVGVTSGVQTQIDGKLADSATAVAANTWGGAAKVIEDTTASVSANMSAGDLGFVI